MSRRFLIIAATVVVYASVIGLTVWSLLAARRSVIDAYSVASEQIAWNEFRAEMDERHVQREAMREEIARGTGQTILPRPPKSRSTRPPALELLTNHFAACVAVSLIAVTVIFAVIWAMTLGAILRPGRTFANDDVSEGGASILRVKA